MDAPCSLPADRQAFEMSCGCYNLNPEIHQLSIDNPKLHKEVRPWNLPVYLLCQVTWSACQCRIEQSAVLHSQYCRASSKSHSPRLTEHEDKNILFLYLLWELLRRLLCPRTLLEHAWKLRMNKPAAYPIFSTILNLAQDAKNMQERPNGALSSYPTSRNPNMLRHVLLLIDERSFCDNLYQWKASLHLFKTKWNLLIRAESACSMFDCRSSPCFLHASTSSATWMLGHIFSQDWPPMQ